MTVLIYLLQSTHLKSDSTEDIFLQLLPPSFVTLVKNIISVKVSLSRRDLASGEHLFYCLKTSCFTLVAAKQGGRGNSLYFTPDFVRLLTLASEFFGNQA